MSTAQIVFYKSKKLSNGEHPIMLRIIKDRKPKYISIGISCSEDLWDEKNNLPKRKHPLYKEFCIKIDKKKLEANKLLLADEEKEGTRSANEIKNLLQKKKRTLISVFSFFDQVIMRLKDSGQVKNSSVYRDTKRMLKHFTGNKDLNFSQLDYSFLIKFEESMKRNELSPNSIYLYLRTLRALFNRAIKEGQSSGEFYPFKNFSLAKYNGIKTFKRAISKESIKKIEKVALIPESSLILSRDIFLFSYYNRGINFIDIAYLKRSNIFEDRLVYKRSKTKEMFSIGMLTPAIKIVERYINPSVDQDSYIFPILKDTNLTPTSKHNRISKILGRVNKDLKVVSLLAGLAENLTTYVARHSFATIMKKNGISVSLISEAMGHDSEKTTQIYLDSFENSQLDNASKVLL
jgi:site-specific recombinase XerD